MSELEERLALTDTQRDQLVRMEREALAINRAHNLYSKESARDFHRRHTLHSLSIASRVFPEGSTVVDWGTGGGMPGLPLAIAFPNVHFVLVDRIKKKTMAVQALIRRLDLPNAEIWTGSADQWSGQAHYAISRATAPLVDLWEWTNRCLIPINATPTSWQPGLIALKGGDLNDEIGDLAGRFPSLAAHRQPLHNLLQDGYFASKYLVHVHDV